MREDYLIESFSKQNITLNETQVRQFMRYYELLVEWNEKMNLTAITEFEEVVQKHFIDSILGSRFMPYLSGRKLIDVGTGAGFPGIPLKILYPDVTVLLLDSLQKRIGFLETVISELGLTGITAVHGRAEELSRKEEYREKYDVCVSRAVARLSSLCEFCLPFVKVNGQFLAYKSQKAEEELKEAENAIKLLSGGNALLSSITLGDDMNRSFIQIKKIDHISDKYPRGGGKPLKQPL